MDLEFYATIVISLLGFTDIVHIKNPILDDFPKGDPMFWNIFKPKVTGEQIKKVVDPLLAEMEERVNWLQSMQKLDVKDGDIVVLRHPGILSKVGIDNLKGAVQKMIKEYGFNIHVMVLEKGTEIGILRKQTEGEIT